MLPTDQLIKKATTTTSTLAALTPKVWASVLEKNLRKQAVFQQSVIENTDLLVPNSGDVVYIPILPDLAAAGNLTEGTDMTVFALNAATSVALTPSEVGLAIEITRKALDRIKYDGIAETVDRLSYSMSLNIETGIANLYNATVPGTSSKITAQYPVVSGTPRTASTITATDTFNDSQIWAAVRYLKEQNNVPFSDGYYRLYISPAQWASLMQDQNVRQDLRFAVPNSLLVGEVGILHGCRIIVSNYVPTSLEGASNAVTVYNAMLLAPRWAAMAWKRRPAVVVDPTLYDMGRRRRFGVLADFDTQLIHADRAVVIKSA